MPVSAPQAPVQIDSSDAAVLLEMINAVSFQGSAAERIVELKAKLTTIAHLTAPTAQRR